MEWLKQIAHNLPIEPAQFVYGFVAICGGVARYLNGVSIGTTQFSFGLFFASTFASGFSGYIFALIGVSMQLPTTILFIMAGTGGFFGDQAMKLVMEFVQTKVV